MSAGVNATWNVIATRKMLARTAMTAFLVVIA